MRLQKLVVAMAVAGTLGSDYVSALGLGEVRLNSSLNQPLDANIELLQVRDLTRNEILPNLASRTDFLRAAVDRPYSLSGLKFKTEISPNGTGYIRVTSTRPIQEPFLNFLLEVHWPSGRLLREYTLLLDPPTFSEQPAQAVRPATTAPYGNASDRPASQNPFDKRGSQSYLPAPEQPYRPEPEPRSQQSQSVQRQVEPARIVTSAPEPARQERYQVQPNENLWSIARSVRPGGDLSIQQTMLAIQRKNPEAFIRDNINLLKQGQVLRVPEREEVAAIPARDAIREVERQNSDWQATLEQLDATRITRTEESPQGEAPSGKLSIVGTDSSAGEGQDLGGGTSSAKTDALEGELALTREKLDELSRENEELKSRLKDLDEQIATLKRLITLKDDQLTTMQQGTVITHSSTPINSDRPPNNESSDPDSTFLGFLLGNPLLLALAGLLPLGLIAGLFFYRRRKQQQAFDFEEEDEEESVAVSVQPDDVYEDPEEELELDESLEIDESLLEEEDEHEEDELDEETVQQTEDAISEADIYIAYGRFPQAVELLGKAIDAEPERADLRLKLLEVHAENNDIESFLKVYAGLEELGDRKVLQQADAYKARFPADAFVGASGVSGGLINLDEESVDEVDQAEELDFDLGDLDLGDLDEDAEVPSAEGGDDAVEFDLDGLDFDETTAEAAPDAEVSDSDGMDFKLDDLDFDNDAPVAGDDLPELDLGDLELPETASEKGEETAAPAALDDNDLALSDDKEQSSEAGADLAEGLPDLESALNDDDLDFLFDDDEAATKLDLARAYIDMGDKEGARDILQEVLESGSDEQKQEAQTLLEQAK
ncbi:MAG: FimV/HubP family polar landmark protein [Endozoicomonas sp.]